MKKENQKNQLLEISSKKLALLKSKNANIEMYVRIALFTGLRYSSISKIKFDDVIIVAGSYFIEINTMKNQTKSNLVKISKDIYTRIQSHKRQSKFNNFIVEGLYSNKPLTAQYINRILTQILDTTTHGLRYCFAICNKINGASADLISNSLFHKNINTTMIYMNHALTTIRLFGKKTLNNFIEKMRGYVYLLDV
jgi:integrase